MNVERRIAFFTIAMAFLAWMAVKLPMPALPMLGSVFHVSNQVFKISVTLNLLGFALSQIFWGSLSDRYGRRVSMISAFSVTIMGTLMAMLALNATMYVVGRVIEGFAVGSAAPVGRAMMADQFSKTTMARVYGWYAIAAILPPAIGPVIGSYLLVYLGWRSIFAFFLILALLYLIALIYWLPETNKQKLACFRLQSLIHDLFDIIKSPKFWMYAVTYALINGFMIAFYAAMPFWYVQQFHMKETSYAWLAFLPIGSYILGSLVVNRFLHRVSFEYLLLLGNVIAILIGVIILIFGMWSHPTILFVTLFMIGFSVASGVVTPMANASLMALFRDKVTILSALLSGMRVGGAGLLVLVSTNINVSTYWPLGIYTTLVACSGLLFFLGFWKICGAQK